MGVAFEVVAGQVVAPGATLTALAMASGDGGLTVRNTPLDAKPRLLQIWADNQANGVLRLRSPKLHDNTQAIRYRITASEVDPLIPFGFPQTLNPQDVIVAELSGSAVAGDREGAALMFYYPNLPGTEGKFFTPAQVFAQMVNLVTVEHTLALAAGPNWTGAQSFQAGTHALKSNTWYALLGYKVDVECLAVGWQAPQWGNIRIGGPGNETDVFLTKDWFVNLSNAYNVPAVPVLSSADLSNIFVDGIQDENVAAVVLTSILAELGGVPQANK